MLYQSQVINTIKCISSVSPTKDIQSQRLMNLAAQERHLAQEIVDRAKRKVNITFSFINLKSKYVVHDIIESTKLHDLPTNRRQSSECSVVKQCISGLTHEL